MAKKHSANQGIIMNGNASIVADNLVVGYKGKIEVGSQARLQAELARLRRQIEALPPTHSKDKEELEAFTSALQTEAARPEPRKSSWKVTASGLIDAAKAVADVAPGVLKTAQLLATWFTGTPI
jgi:hypothetical protein